MFIVSPKWVYLSNKKIECNKSLLIDRSVIVDILVDNKISKTYEKLPRIFYQSHLMVPTFSESYIDIDDCDNQLKYDRKINNLFQNGVTRVQVVANNYKKILKYAPSSSVNISYKITLDSFRCTYEDIKDILKTIDFYKSDTSRIFSINLLNVINFEKDLIIKISSICNELNLSIDIHLNEINDLSDNETNTLFKFWEEINLLNNCVVHDFLNSKKMIQNYISKYKILMCVKYSELLDIENIKLLLSLKSHSNRYVLISDSENTYKLYDLLKVINLFSKNEIAFDDKKILNSVTSNASDFFAETSSSGVIEKYSLASFNIFDIKSKRFLWKDENYPTIADLDNESLTAVWSSGECVNIKT